MTQTTLVPTSMPPADPWVHLVCPKCSSELQVKPADAADRNMLYLLPTDDDPAAKGVEGPGCPICAHLSGGHYPLFRVVSDEEHKAMLAFKAALLVRLATPEYVDRPDDSAMDEDEWESHCADVWNGAFREEDRHKARLIALGYPRDVLSDLSESLILREGRNQRTRS